MRISDWSSDVCSSDLDRDGDHRYDDPGLTLYRTWLQVAPGIVFGDDMGDWWKAIDEGRYLTYQSSLLLRAFQGDAAGAPLGADYFNGRSEEHTSELQSLMRISYAGFCLNKKNT